MARVTAIGVLIALAQAPCLALELEQLEQQALSHQPQLLSLARQREAAYARAVAVRQLPDPRLTAGVDNLPTSGDSRFDVGDDFMTMAGVSLMQEFPTREKRRLKGRVQDLLAKELDAREQATSAAIRRDVGLAFVDAWRPQRALELMQALIAEARRELEAANIAFRVNRISQARRLESTVMLELLEDRRLSLQQASESATAKLFRWTGATTARAKLGAPRGLPPPPPLDELISRIDQHPELLAADADIAARDNAISLARAEYKPDWRFELGYAWRPEFSEMAMFKVGIDLPVFTASRQDKSLLAAQSEADAVHAMHVDHARALVSRASAAHRNWTRLQQRLERFDNALLPAARARVEAALAAYRAGKGEMSDVLRARRDALDAELMRLDIEADLIRSQLQLRYLAQRGELS